jgi:uncharacterized protein YaaQ
MQGMLAIVQSQDADSAMERLQTLDLPGLSRIASMGGFLRQGNTTLWIAMHPEQISQVMGVLRETCHRRTSYMPTYMEAPQLAMFPLEVEVGGATIFICDVERYEVF